jgi:hypothetical protein
VVLWPFAVALVWCGGMLLSRWRTGGVSTLGEGVFAWSCAVYHFPILYLAVCFWRGLKSPRRFLPRELLVIIFLTAVLYSALFTWVL